MIDYSYRGQRMAWKEIKIKFPDKIVCLTDAENMGTKKLIGTIICIVDTMKERDSELIKLHKENNIKQYWRYTTNPQETMGITGIWGL